MSLVILSIERRDSPGEVRHDMAKLALPLPWLAPGKARRDTANLALPVPWLALLCFDVSLSLLSISNKHTHYSV